MSKIVDELTNWILKHDDQRYIIRRDDRRIILRTDDLDAIVKFNPSDIVEYSIQDRMTEEDLFYLHFQLNDLEHAKTLFAEMLQSLSELHKKKKIPVLLSCSNAFTTTFFAHKLNESADMLGMPFSFSAVSFDKLGQYGSKCKAILIAPQIAFCAKRAKELFPDRPVETIPGKLYGSYDVRGVLLMVEDMLRKNEEATVQTATEAVMPENNARILSIITYIDGTFRIRARIIDHGITESETMTIKPKFVLSDIADMIDAITAVDDDFDAVVMSLPGIIGDGKMYLRNSGSGRLEINDYFRQKYPYRFYFINSANATALGLSLVHPGGTTIYHSQLSTDRKGGQGIVIDGKLITGKNAIAGEITDVLQKTDKDQVWENGVTAVDVCAKMILSDICFIGPHRVYIHCKLIPDPKPVRDHLLEWIEEEFIPDLYTLKDIAQYTIAGGLMYCLQKMKEEGVVIRRR